MPTNKKTIKTYRVEVTAMVEVFASFEIEASTKDKAEKEAEGLFEDEIDSSISSMGCYEDYTLENIEAEASESE